MNERHGCNTGSFIGVVVFFTREITSTQYFVIKGQLNYERPLDLHMLYFHYTYVNSIKQGPICKGISITLRQLDLGDSIRFQVLYQFRLHLHDTCFFLLQICKLRPVIMGFVGC